MSIGVGGLFSPRIHLLGLIHLTIMVSSDNGLVLSKLLGTESEGDSQDGWHLDGDVAKQDEDVVKTTTVRGS